MINEQGAVEEKEEEETHFENGKQTEASGLSKGHRPWWVSYQPLRGSPKADPKNLICKAGSPIERLELHILETKAGHDGVYDEMLDI